MLLPRRLAVEGAVTCLADMLADVRAAFDFLVEQRRVAHHIRSMASPSATRSRRRSSSSRARRVRRSRPIGPFFVLSRLRARPRPRHALGQQRATEPAEEAEEGEAGGEPPAPRAAARGCEGRCVVIGFARASAAQIGVIWARSTGWGSTRSSRGSSSRAADRGVQRGRQHHQPPGGVPPPLERASQAAAEEATTTRRLLRRPERRRASDSVPLAHDPSGSGRDLLAGVTVIESEIRYAQGWAMHDFRSLDPEAWYAMIAAERSALGLPAQR